MGKCIRNSLDALVYMQYPVETAFEMLVSRAASFHCTVWTSCELRLYAVRNKSMHQR